MKRIKKYSLLATFAFGLTVSGSASAFSLSDWFQGWSGAIKHGKVVVADSSGQKPKKDHESRSSGQKPKK